MLMVSDELRIGLVTNHLPLSDVANAVTQAKITYKLNMLNQTLRVDFGIERPTIAVLGLNPHAGDEGAIGGEETKIILPAIMQAKEKVLWPSGLLLPTAFLAMALSKNLMRYWLCTTIRDWDLSKPFLLEMA